MFIGCPKDFIFDPSQMFCHKPFLEPLTWAQASAACNKRGAHLVSINTEVENNYLMHLPEGKFYQ